MAQNKTRDSLRELVIQVLTQLFNQRTTLDDILSEYVKDLTTQERAWVMDLTAGVLRWRGRLDVLIDQFSTKKKPTGWLRKALWLGFYQLLAQERAFPAQVVSETVDLIKAKEGEGPAKFGNALMRSLIRELEAGKLKNHVWSAGWAGLPDWIWKRLEKQHGLAWAKAYAEASLERPKTWLRTKEGPKLQEDGGAILKEEGFAEGSFIVQDISNQKMITEITEVLRQANVKTVLDLCAAPGGKSIALAWEGFDVIATDYKSKRIGRLLENIQRTNTSNKIKVLDFQDIWKKIDDVETDLPRAILIDAPCTGTGVLRRHPEIRWMREEKDLAGLLKIQADLVRQSWEVLKSGEFLIYIVCSVLKEEGEELIKGQTYLQNPIKKWFFAPQNEPFGDGFWGVMIKK